jgi:rubrerythrin
MIGSRSNPSLADVSSRRRVLTAGGIGVLSATAVALLGGNEALAQQMQQRRPAGNGDVAILNVALGLEHEAINAYQIGAESNLLQPAVLQVAVAFQSHHKSHRDALIATIRQMNGTPVAEKTRQEYVTSLNAASIRSQVDILHLAQRLERGAANAYLGVIPSFANRDLAKVAGRLAADETMHYTALTQALNEALPGQALSFGA